MYFLDFKFSHNGLKSPLTVSHYGLLPNPLLLFGLGQPQLQEMTQNCSHRPKSAPQKKENCTSKIREIEKKTCVNNSLITLIRKINPRNTKGPT